MRWGVTPLGVTPLVRGLRRGLWCDTVQLQRRTTKGSMMDSLEKQMADARKEQVRRMRDCVETALAAIDNEHFSYAGANIAEADKLWDAIFDNGEEWLDGVHHL